MCVIIHFKPKQMIDKEALFNACANNWHSYGLVTRVDKKLDIVRKVPENGEVDSEEIYKLLQDNFKYDRYLHVRHNTAGETSLENTHPFDVYYDPKTGNQVVFMHNGTLYEYKSRITETKNGVTSTRDDDSGPSDTKNFVDQVLIPYTASDFGDGAGSIDNILYRRVISKFWPTTGANRGLLISNKGDYTLGSWTTYGSDENRLTVSNDDYFSKITRGPEFTRRRVREEEEKKRKEAERPVINTSSLKTGVARFRDYDVEKTYDLFELKETMANILGDWDVWDRSGMTALGYATMDEIGQLYADKKSCIQVMDLVFTEFTKMAKELEELEEKKDRGEKLIASLQSTIKTLKEKAA